MNKIKILIIDDEIDDLINIQKLFIKAGYDVQICNSGEQGLEYLTTFNADAVLCDVVMQHMSGIDCLREIRKAKKNLPIFLYTDTSNEKYFKDAQIYNATGYFFSKNLTEQEIDVIKILTNIYLTS